MLTNRLPLIIVIMAFSLTSLCALASQPETFITRFESRSNYIVLEAKLEAIKQSTVSAQTQGIIEKINFDINDKVEAGQVLVLINSSQQQASLSQAKAALAQAQALNTDAQNLLTRNRSLLLKKTLSQGEFDSSLARANSSKSSVLAAEAFVKQAKEQVSYTRITAPYSGIVSQRFVQLGELINPGQPVMTGFALKPLRAVVDIPQTLAVNLSAHTKLNKLVHIIANDEYYPISRITLFPYADSHYNSVRARLDLTETDDTQSLMPGAWVQAQLPNGQQDGLYIPASSILQQGEVASVLVKQNDTFKLRYVRVGQTQPDGRVRILSGLEAGEHIAIDVLAAAMAISMPKGML